MTRLTAMSFNVRWGAAAPHAFEGVLATVARLAPDVLVLQECVEWEGTDRLERVARAMDVPPQNARLGPATLRRTKRMDVCLLSRLPIAVGSSRVDLQACKLEYSIVSPK